MSQSPDSFNPIGPVSLSSNDTVSDPDNGASASYAISVDSSVSGADSQSGSISLAGSLDASTPDDSSYANGDFSSSCELDFSLLHDTILTLNYTVNAPALPPAFKANPVVSIAVDFFNQASLDDNQYQIALPEGNHSLTIGFGATVDPVNAFGINTTYAASCDVSWQLGPVIHPSITTLLSPSPHLSIYGQPVTFSATVSPATLGLPTATGTVTFMDGSKVMGTGTLNDSGATTFTTLTPLTVGDHSITAVYGGDSNFSGSTSLPITQTVSPPTSSTPSIVPMSLARAVDSQLGPGVDFTYSVTGDLTQGSVISFYWADGQGFENRFDNDPVAYSYTVNTPALERQGTHGPIFVPRNSFTGIDDSSILDDATHLLMVTDNPDGTHNVVALPLVVPITLTQVMQIASPPPPVPGPPPVKPVKPTPKQRATYDKLYKAWNAANNVYVTYNELSLTLVDFLNSAETENTFKIRTSLRRAAFIGQAMHETAGLRQGVELPSTHTSSKSKYKGRGFLQITGKGNYQAAGNYLGVDLVAHPDLLATVPMLGARASGWYWDRATGRSLNRFADKWDITDISIYVNYGKPAIIDSQGRVLIDGQILYSYTDKKGKYHTTTNPNAYPGELPVKVLGVADRQARSDSARAILADFW